MPVAPAAVRTIPVSGAVPSSIALALPAGLDGVDLAAIPDRLLNDPPDARLGLAVDVRGTKGIASTDAPFEIAWSEAGYWYWMRSGHMPVPRLIEIAGALQ